ncbi:MAG: TIGR02536 family ethanolamine utilization protein, partial [Clostridium sp.]
MEYDNLVNIIVEEVYKKLREGQNSNNINRKAVVIGDSNIEKYLDILGSEYDLTTYTDSIKDCEVVIVPKLCLKGMGNLANLTCSTSEEHFIIKMLMKGRKVYIIEDGMFYKKYKNSAPKQLYNKYLEFEKTLINYGVEILSSSFKSISKIEEKSYVSSDRSISKTCDVIKKKLITESDVRAQYIKGCRLIVIDKKSIVTPLAKDFIRINHIEIM